MLVYRQRVIVHNAHTHTHEHDAVVVIVAGGGGVIKYDVEVVNFKISYQFSLFYLYFFSLSF